ncbi:MAG: amidohydrolase [Acidobacteriota bacterium]|nr:amidohydrolase [Acidobacteriota bacterium]
MPIVDIHSHFFPEATPDFSARFAGPPWPSIRHDAAGQATIMLGDREFRRITSACWDAEARVADMERDGVDLQVLCATPVLFAYDRPAGQALECARIYNDLALDVCARANGRLRALCQVPLQDVDMACGEVSRAMRAGHIGVQIGSHVGPKNLDDDGLVRFLAHCASEGAPVLVHPWDMLGPDRTARYMAGWTVGMPAETQLAIVSLILGGGFDRLPPSLRICFVHGGGSFAYLLGRLENAWRNRDIARGVSEHPPSHYLTRFFVDSAVFDDRALRLLVEVMGDQRVMLGSDYPFPLGEQRVGSLVRHSPSLDATSKERILGGNACGFFALSDSVAGATATPGPAAGADARLAPER